MVGNGTYVKFSTGPGNQYKIKGSKTSLLSAL
jgi:hypothetical protein